MADTITAADIRWALAPGPSWPDATDILQAAVALLPTIQDDTAADLIEGLAAALVDAQEQVRATTVTRSVTLALLHREVAETRRLRQRLHDLLDATRKSQGVS